MLMCFKRLWLLIFDYNMRIDERKDEEVNALKKNISMTLDVEVIEGMRKLAEENDRSLSQYVNLVLKKYLKSREEKED